MNWLVDAMYTLKLVLARHRVAASIVLNGLSSLMLGALFFTLTLTSHAHYAFACLTFFVLFTGLAAFLNVLPRHMERKDEIEALLPSIFTALDLSRDTTRITLHFIRSTVHESYSQVTNYFPTGDGLGRRFHFTQGITGQAFRTRKSHAYSIPEGVTLHDDCRTRWQFKDEEIVKLKQDRRSFYTYPMGERAGYAEIVLYCDSSDPNTFSSNKKLKLDETMQAVFFPVLVHLFGASNRPPKG